MKDKFKPVDYDIKFIPKTREKLETEFKELKINFMEMYNDNYYDFQDFSSLCYFEELEELFYDVLKRVN